jgi:hypothetical protein
LIDRRLGSVERAATLLAAQLIEAGLAARHLGARRRELVSIGASAHFVEVGLGGGGLVAQLPECR